jgi:hypothetical protein
MKPARSTADSVRARPPAIRRSPQSQPNPRSPQAGNPLRGLQGGGAERPADLLALQRLVGNRAVQRLAASLQRESLEGAEGELAQRQADPGWRRGGPASPQTEQAIQAERGGGQALPERLRAPMESAFNSDFGKVRLHTGPTADRLNRSLSAKAFTLGSDIFFRQGQYKPGSTHGNKLIAHELTHVVQQSGPVAQRSLASSRAGAIQRETQQVGGENGPRIKNEDFEYEIIGHRLAYRKDTSGAEAWLERIGYEPEFAGEATGFGFRVVLLMPKEGSGRTPILAFKGSNKIPDFIVDLDPIAVGFLAFKHNQDKVKALIAQAGGRVDVTGHSLGGALAQHCASAFPGSVRRVVTFQSPGISMIQSAMFDSLGDDKPEVTHHVSGGDVVDMAGGSHLSGTTFVHGARGKGLGGIGKGHTSYLLNSEALKEQREGAGIPEDLIVNLGLAGKLSNATGEVTEHENYPFTARGFGVERGRELGGILGLGVGPLYGLIAGGGLAAKGAWKGLKAAGRGLAKGASWLGSKMWGGMKAAGRGIAKGAETAWGGVKSGARAVGRGAQYLGSQFASFFRRGDVGA